MTKPPVLCIVGPTASGKTGLSLRIAKALGGEVISMDSMQIYRGMDIGTAKPSLTERAGIPHHLMDVIPPSQPYTVAQYAEDADQAIREVWGRGKLPMLVGGTGFYLKALTHGLTLGGIQSDPVLRDKLKAIAAGEDGKRQLHARLQLADPETAARLHPNDVQRVSRALEVLELTGRPISAQSETAYDPGYTFCMLGTTMARDGLYRRINARVQDMMRQGLLGEVRALLESGVPPTAQAMQGIGYKELVPVLLHQADLTDAVASIQQNSRHYAKRQWTWFRAEPRIQWLDMENADSFAQALEIAKAFWKEAET